MCRGKFLVFLDELGMPMSVDPHAYLKWLDEQSVPRATEQEDSMSEVTFTQEQRDAIMQYWNEREWRPLWLPDANEFVDWLDAHTEKPLTFPCPGCGVAMEREYNSETGRYRGKCFNHLCSVERTKFFETEVRLSEALSD